VIRDELGMTGTKYGCGLAQCGACSVMVDGEVLRSCVMPVGAMAGRKVTTIEAVTADPVGQKWSTLVRHQVPQCGYCQSGQVMAATACSTVAQPSDEQIVGAMVNLCRCGTYNAIKAAMHELSGGTGAPAAAAAATTPAAPAAADGINKTAVAAAAVVGVGAVAAIQWSKTRRPGPARSKHEPATRSSCTVSPDGAPVNVSRRRFLLASAGTAAGALVVGFTLPAGNARAQANAAPAAPGTRVPAFGNPSRQQHPPAKPLRRRRAGHLHGHGADRRRGTRCRPRALRGPQRARQ
jgi:isoquinoline 1-oxidoreductase alpha subunit